MKNKSKKNKKASLIILVCLMVMGLTKVAAQVGTTNNNPDKSAVLDLNETNKGLLIPNVSLTSTTVASQINGGAPAVSLLVYNTNPSITGTGAAGTGYYFWNSGSWKKLITANDVASLQGPAGAAGAKGAPGAPGGKGPKGDPGDAGAPGPAPTIAALTTGFRSVVSLTGSPNNAVINATGIDFKPGTANQVLMTVPSSGNPAVNVVKWVTPPPPEQLFYEMVDTLKQAIYAGDQRTFTRGLSVTLSKASYVLINYSAYPSSVYENPGSGRLDLMVDGNIAQSMAYLGVDSYATIGFTFSIASRVTFSKVMLLEAGPHNFNLQAKGWSGGATFNIGSIRKSYISVLVLKK